MYFQYKKNMWFEWFIWFRYTVHSFTESYRDFTIHIKAYDQVEKIVKNKTTTDYVNGGEIVLSPSRKAGVGKYNRVSSRGIYRNMTLGTTYL